MTQSTSALNTATFLCYLTSGAQGVLLSYLLLFAFQMPSAFSFQSIYLSTYLRSYLTLSLARAQSTSALNTATKWSLLCCVMD